MTKRQMGNVSIALLLGLLFAGLPRQSIAEEFDKTDMPGMDFQNFDLGRSFWEDCRTACKANGHCMTWTYVRAGYQGPKARCWLKSGRPQRVQHPCCISGITRVPFGD